MSFYQLSLYFPQVNIQLTITEKSLGFNGTKSNKIQHFSIYEKVFASTPLGKAIRLFQTLFSQNERGPLYMFT
jgi:hypothetical protein